MTLKLESVLLQTNGIRLHTIQAGPVDGPLVLLLHGFPEFWRGWINQIPALAEAGLRVVAPDQRGYNLSDKPKGVQNYRLSELTADVIGLLDSLGQEKCFLAGHDWGAAVAWETAIRYPDRINKLAILNVPHPEVMSKFILGNPNQTRKSWYIFAFQIPWLPEALLRANDWELAVQMLQQSGRASTFNTEDFEYYRRAWWQKDAMTSMINWYRAAFRTAAQRTRQIRSAQPRRVTVPTLILWGENDVALSKEMAQPSCDLCDQAELITFPNATHWVQHDEAEAVNRLLVNHFSPR